MNFIIGILSYIVLFLLVLVVLIKLNINTFSALTVAALVSLVFLIILIPPSNIDKYTDDMLDGTDHDSSNNAAITVICLIYIITLLLVFWYVLCKAYDDRADIILEPCTSIY